MCVRRRSCPETMASCLSLTPCRTPASKAHCSGPFLGARRRHQAPQREAGYFPHSPPSSSWVLLDPERAPCGCLAFLTQRSWEMGKSRGAVSSMSWRKPTSLPLAGRGSGWLGPRLSLTDYSDLAPLEPHSGGFRGLLLNRSLPNSTPVTTLFLLPE